MSHEKAQKIAEVMAEEAAKLVAEHSILHSYGTDLVGQTTEYVKVVAPIYAEQAAEAVNEVIEKQGAELREQYNQERYKVSMTPEDLSKIDAQNRADDENLKEQGESRVEVEQPPAEVLHNKQLTEMEGLKADLEFQKEAAQKELEKLGLDAKGRDEFCRNEYDMSVQKMNEMFAAHDQERADLKGDNESIPADIQAQRSQMSGDLCHAEAERQVTAENDARVQSYGEKRTPEPALLQSYQEFLNTTAPQEIEARTETLQEQNFPQISREGPSTSMNGPEGNSPPSPGGSSGPDSGPDRNDM